MDIQIAFTDLLGVTDTSETQMTEPESIPSFTILPKTLPWSIEAKLNDKVSQILLILYV